MQPAPRPTDPTPVPLQSQQPTDPSTHEPCLDSHPLCETWAGNGYCGDSNGFVWARCRRSCGECGPATTTTASTTSIIPTTFTAAVTAGNMDVPARSGCTPGSLVSVGCFKHRGPALDGGVAPVLQLDGSSVSDRPIMTACHVAAWLAGFNGFGLLGGEWCIGYNMSAQGELVEVLPALSMCAAQSNRAFGLLLFCDDPPWPAAGDGAMGQNDDDAKLEGLSPPPVCLCDATASSCFARGCDCPVGFRRDGSRCVNNNECESSNPPCSRENTLCLDTMGSFMCICLDLETSSAAGGNVRDDCGYLRLPDVDDGVGTSDSTAHDPGSMETSETDQDPQGSFFSKLMATNLIMLVVIVVVVLGTVTVWHWRQRHRSEMRCFRADVQRGVSVDGTEQDWNDSLDTIPGKRWLKHQPRFDQHGAPAYDSIGSRSRLTSQAISALSSVAEYEQLPLPNPSGYELHPGPDSGGRASSVSSCGTYDLRTLVKDGQQPEGEQPLSATPPVSHHCASDRAEPAIYVAVAPVYQRAVRNINVDRRERGFGHQKM